MATLLNSPAAPAPARPRLIHLWHLASLDAPTVAVVWACSLGWCAGVRLRPVAVAVLALVTWIIYVADRLLDVRLGLQAELRDRHFFHWRHRRIFLMLAGFAMASAAGLVFLEIPAHIRRPDGFAALAALAWLAGVHTRVKLPPILSHAAVGLIFAAGCALPVWPRVPSIAELPYAPILGFAALAWLNLRAIEAWELATPAFITPAALTLAATLGFAAISTPRTAMLFAAQAASALLIALLDRSRLRLAPLSLRALADLVLLAPAALLLR